MVFLHVHFIDVLSPEVILQSFQCMSCKQLRTVILFQGKTGYSNPFNTKMRYNIAYSSHFIILSLIITSAKTVTNMFVCLSLIVLNFLAHTTLK